MKFPLYCIRDIHVGFGTPMLNNNDQCAIRDFKYKFAAEGIMLNNAKDFDLYCIGEFNTEDGKVTPQLPLLIISGVDAVQEK